MSSLILVRFGALGDTLMLTPVFRYLARRVGPVDYVGRAPWSRQLLAPQPELRAVAQIGSKRVPGALSREKQTLLDWLRRRRSATFIDLESDEVSAALLDAAGIPGRQVIRRSAMAIGRGHSHQVYRTLARVRAALEGRSDIGDLDAALALHVPEPWHADATAWLTARDWLNEELVLVAPGNKRTMSWRPYWRNSNRKHWPLGHWARLCARLLAHRPGARVLIVGAPAEQRLARIIARQAGSERVHAVADDMPTTRMMALMARALGAITLDSGPAHAAAAVDCPVVTLFNATNPAHFLPLAASGRVRAVTPGNVTLDDWRPGLIEVDEVFAAWREIEGLPAITEAGNLAASA